VPRRKRVVLGFSRALGAFLSRARLLRALRGFLNCISFIFTDEADGGGNWMLTFVATSYRCGCGIWKLMLMLAIAKLGSKSSGSKNRYR
jgi:hypothetical protein